MFKQTLGNWVEGRQGMVRAPPQWRSLGEALEGLKQGTLTKLGEMVVGLGLTQCGVLWVTAPFYHIQVSLPELEPVKFQRSELDYLLHGCLLLLCCSC